MRIVVAVVVDVRSRNIMTCVNQSTAELYAIVYLHVVADGAALPSVGVTRHYDSCIGL